MASAVVTPHDFTALRTPSGLHKVIRIVPDTTISLGKYGSFPANAIIGRPFYMTFEILDKAEDGTLSALRIIPVSELHAEALSEEKPTAAESRDDTEVNGDGLESIDIVGEDGEYLIKNNRLTIDDPSRQALTMEEIEMLKKSMNTGSGKDIIARIMQSHSALDQKTAFSLAKYTMRKSKKYLKRFTVYPLDVSTLSNWMLHEKEPARIMDVREECLGLVASWSNIHGGGLEHLPFGSGQGRWLVVDDTGGLLVAALAERMGILHPSKEDSDSENETRERSEANQPSRSVSFNRKGSPLHTPGETPFQPETHTTKAPIPRSRRRPARPPIDSMSASSNTLTVVHAATQPNLSILSYFGYDPNETAAANMSHPLHAHLKSLTWLQLLHPENTASYAQEPDSLSEDALASLKPSKRGNYHRKRRRWARTVRVVDETRAGGFDGLVVASSMAPHSIMHHLVPLVKGGGQCVVYSPSVEPLSELLDLYSSARKTAYLGLMDEARDGRVSGEDINIPNEDFPLDPRLLLGPSLQTARANEWQVLPGRTHPLMTSRGGSEGYIFTGTRVLPAEGKVEARGAFNKKRKILPNDTTAGMEVAEQVAEQEAAQAS